VDDNPAEGTAVGHAAGYGPLALLAQLSDRADLDVVTVTLVAGGALISGRVVGGWEFFNDHADAFRRLAARQGGGAESVGALLQDAFEQFAGEYVQDRAQTTPELDTDAPESAWLHLKEATVTVGGTGTRQAGSWRVRIDQVAAWTIEAPTG
jgi:hypothetical protein